MKSKRIVSMAACAALFLFQAAAGAQSSSGQTGSSSSGQMGTQSGTSSTQSQTPGTAGTSTGMKGTMSDREFLKKAAEGGLLEVELGRLATQKGSTEAVRQYGQRMVDDHGKVNDRVKQIASQKGITLPTSLDSKHRAIVQRLSKLSGERFDQAYIQEMHKDHMEDVSEFEKVSGNSTSDLKPFAEETLPTLRDHLATAQNLSASMGGQTSSSSTPSHDMDTSSSRKGKSKPSSSQPGTDTSTQPK